MFFRQRLAKEATLSYLLGCGSCAVGVAVDPVAGDEDWFMEEAARQAEEFIARQSDQVGMKMIRYIYGKDQAPEPRHDRRRRWWGWEI